MKSGRTAWVGLKQFNFLVGLQHCFLMYPQACIYQAAEGLTRHQIGRCIHTSIRGGGLRSFIGQNKKDPTPLPHLKKLKTQKVNKREKIKK